MKAISSFSKILNSYKIKNDTYTTLSLYKDGSFKPLKKKTLNFNSKISFFTLIKIISFIVVVFAAASFIINKCRKKRLIKKLEEKYLLVPIDKIEYADDCD